ncbi:Phosphate regulon sensor protein PhoR [compost metagenome]
MENECTPVPEKQLLRLYEPFYRPDVSRSRETGGNGLGLYIVETILRRLELNYRFEPMTLPEGMRFAIDF